MKENRASKGMQASFRAQRYANGGLIGRRIELDKNPLKATLSNESKIRNEIHNSLRKLVSNNASVEDIKQFFSKEEYKNYEQYLDSWIKDLVIKLNPSIKSLITKTVNEGKKEDEIIEEIRLANGEVCEKYEPYFRIVIQTRIQEKQRKIEELKNKENKEEELR